MGNRAVIVFTDADAEHRVTLCGSAPCVYLHWNGGRASVEGMLEAARELSYADLDRHPAAADRRDEFARLVQAWFKNGSVLVGQYRNMDDDNGDNGVYIVDAGLEIIGRLFSPRQEEIDADKTRAIRSELIALASSRGHDLSGVVLQS